MLDYNKKTIQRLKDMGIKNPEMFGIELEGKRISNKNNTCDSVLILGILLFISIIINIIQFLL